VLPVFFMSVKSQTRGFADFRLHPALLREINRLGFDTPTPIQTEAIPHLLEGRDVVGIAQTGTGKTLAFGAPMLNELRSGEFGLVLAPTRELAQQIADTFTSLKARVALLVGGEPMPRQLRQLKSQPDVVVATPGRLEDHMGQKTIDLRDAAIVVLDEADRMLDMGFAPALKRILAATPSDRQTMLFSATMPPEIRRLADQYLVDPIEVEVATAGTTAETIDQEVIVLPNPYKRDMVRQLLTDHKGSVLIFARTRFGAKKLASTIRTFGHSAAEIHSDRTLPQRREALSGFKSGKFRVLVATDIAARGIDVKEISLVLNYDLPDQAEDYIHRIGRTGRAGAQGKAISLATPEQTVELNQIEALIGEKISVSDRSMVEMPSRPQPSAQFRPAVQAFRSRRRR